MSEYVVIEIKITNKDLQEKELEELDTVESLNAVQLDDGILEVCNIPILCANKISYRDRLRRTPHGSFEIVSRGQYRTFLVEPTPAFDTPSGIEAIDEYLALVDEYGVERDAFGNLRMLAYREPIAEEVHQILENNTDHMFLLTQLSPVFPQKIAS